MEVVASHLSCLDMLVIFLRSNHTTKRKKYWDTLGNPYFISPLPLPCYREGNSLVEWEGNIKMIIAGVPPSLMCTLFMEEPTISGSPSLY